MAGSLEGAQPHERERVAALADALVLPILPPAVLGGADAERQRYRAHHLLPVLVHHGTHPLLLGDVWQPAGERERKGFHHGWGPWRLAPAEWEYWQAGIRG